MLYQLSYASPAQTEQKYHRGNRIASKYLSPCKTLASTALIRRPFSCLTPYCAAGLENSEFSKGTLCRTSVNLIVKTDSALD
jgi:hypothetical protein